MKVYSPSEVATLLNVKPATLRKYSIMLEEQGYKIERNSQNHRYYSDNDIITLRRVITGSKSGATLEEAIHNVVSIDDNNTYTNAINNGDTANDSDIKELKEMVYKQNEVIKEFSKRLDRQQEYIENSLKERDRLLMQSMNELLENKKQIAAAEEEKRGLLARLFKKKKP